LVPEVEALEMEVEKEKYVVEVEMGGHGTEKEVVDAQDHSNMPAFV
jgi:hypothetical protein